MKITYANTRDGIVYVYEKDRLLFTKEGELIAYDKETISVSKDTVIFIYDTKGNLLAF